MQNPRKEQKLMLEIYKSKTLTEIINTLDGLTSRLNKAEERL